MPTTFEYFQKQTMNKSEAETRRAKEKSEAGRQIDEKAGVLVETGRARDYLQAVRIVRADEPELWNQYSSRQRDAAAVRGYAVAV